jgi:hypothetical protein
MMELLQSDERRLALAERLRTRAEKFLSWDAIAERTLNVDEESPSKAASRNESLQKHFEKACRLSVVGLLILAALSTEK